MDTIDFKLIKRDYTQVSNKLVHMIEVCKEQCKLQREVIDSHLWDLDNFQRTGEPLPVQYFATMRYVELEQEARLYQNGIIVNAQWLSPKIALSDEHNNSVFRYFNGIRIGLHVILSKGIVSGTPKQNLIKVRPPEYVAKYFNV